MRTTGVVTSPRGLGAHDHLCWSYGHGDDIRTERLAFVTDGIALNQRVGYIGCATEDELLADLAGIEGLDELLAKGAVGALSVTEQYRTEELVDPEAQVARYTAATEDALASGFSGLRVTAEVTDLLLNERQREVFGRYEHLIDRSMVTMPFSAMCCYDRTVIGDEAVADLACMHPSAREGASPFQVFAIQGADLGVAGEVDTLSAPRFVRALRRAVPDAGGELVIDASGLSFIDHHGLLALEAMGAAGGDGPRVVLEHAPPIAARVAELLELERVEVRS